MNDRKSHLFHDVISAGRASGSHEGTFLGAKNFGERRPFTLGRTTGEWHLLLCVLLWKVWESNRERGFNGIFDNPSGRDPKCVSFRHG